MIPCTLVMRDGRVQSMLAMLCEVVCVCAGRQLGLWIGYIVAAHLVILIRFISLENHSRVSFRTRNSTITLSPQ